MTDSMGLVHVVWGAGLGGIERLVSDLSRVQAAEGMDVRVLVCASPSDDPLLARYAAPGVAVVAAGLHSGFDLRPSAIRAMTEIMAKASVVHLHGFVPSIAIAACRAKRPIVFTEHGLLGLERKRFVLSLVKQVSKGMFLRRCVSVVACVSDWVTNVVISKYRFRAERVYCTPNGLDLGKVRSTRSRDEALAAEGIDPTAWVMVVTARLAKMKRIDRLLEAAAMLRRSGREWVLLIVGEGPLEDELREQCTARGIEARVRFIGYRRNVWDLVAAADLIPVPSGLEPFGLVVVEAMALGRPVVAFADSGGPAEIVRKVGGGCLVESVADLAALMEKGREGSSLHGFSPLDRTQFEALYSIDRTASEYARLYAGAIESTQNGDRDGRH